MPPNPDRPKIKFKRGYEHDGRGRRARRRKKTRDEIQAKNIAKLEKRHNISPNLVSEMILRQRGLLSYVARSLKVPRQTLVRYIEKHPDCIEALEHARAAMGDKAEQKLFEAIDAGDTRCILYYLSTVHRHRGYGLRDGDITGDTTNGHGPVFVETVNIVGIPPGTYLPKEIAAKDNMVIENQ